MTFTLPGTTPVYRQISESPAVIAEPHQPAGQRTVQLKHSLHQRLIQGIDLSVLRNMNESQLRSEFRRGAEELCRTRPDLLNAAERKQLIDELVDETLGFGPLEPLLRDPSVADILINGPQMVYVERNGQLEKTDITFYDDDHLVALVQKIAGRVGRRVDESSPMVDARLPDGSRINAVIRPLALNGALVSIRRFGNLRPEFGVLLQNQTFSPEILKFLAACVEGRLNMLLSGGTGSGKTTLLNVLSSFIPAAQRIVTIEDAAELNLRQPHVARMETRSANLEGIGEVTIRDLLRNALRMRPDRILIGECRGPEAFEMLQAMNTGHDGSLTTIHANSAQDALDRLAMLVSMGKHELPLEFITRQIAATIQIIVHTARLVGGARKVVQVAEVTGVANGSVTIQNLFTFEQQGIDANGLAQGGFRSTGKTPACLGKLRAAGISFNPTIFSISNISGSSPAAGTSPGRQALP